MILTGKHVNGLNALFAEFGEKIVEYQTYESTIIALGPNRERLATWNVRDGCIESQVLSTFNIVLMVSASIEAPSQPEAAVILKDMIRKNTFADLIKEVTSWNKAEGIVKLEN